MHTYIPLVPYIFGNRALGSRIFSALATENITWFFVRKLDQFSSFMAEKLDFHFKNAENNQKNGIKKFQHSKRHWNTGIPLKHEEKIRK